MTPKPAVWSRFTSLARILDPRLPSHRSALLVAVGAATLSLANLGDMSIWQRAFNAGVASFLAWALAREVDPDRPDSALLAGVIAGGTLALLGPALLLPLALVLVMARILHRSTGLPPTLFDLLALLGVAYIGAASTVGWAAALALAFAVARDHRLPSPAPRRQLLAAFVLASVATAGAVVGGEVVAWELPGVGAATVLLVGVVAGLTLRTYVPVSRADHTGEVLEVKRLQSSRRGALGAGLLALAFAGGSGVVALSPLWSALVGVAIWDRLGVESAPDG